MKSSLRKSHLNFWNEHPALGLGTSALLGIGNPLLGILWLGYHFFLSRSQSFLYGALVLFFFLYTQILSSQLPEFASGTFCFRIHEVKRHSSPVQKGWIYKGTINALPCSIVYYGKEKERPLANRDYQIFGTLQKRGPFSYVAKTNDWKPLPSSWSLAEFRYSVKERFRMFLRTHIPETKSSSFLSALFLGDLEDTLLRYEFSRLGLQHILAISGFHFGILIAFLSFAIRPFFSANIRIFFLFFSVLFYFLLVGDSPSVFRTFSTLTFFLIGQYTVRQASGLNLLGCSLLVELLLNPFVLYTIGFQLSFLSCLGILLFHQPIERLFSPLFPSRSFEELKQLSLSAQCGAILLSFFKNSLLITLAVYLVLWPLLLFHFHYVPLLGLFYNLFVPGMVSVCLFLLMVALILYAIIPLLSLPIFKLTHFFTGELLELISYPPLILDFHLSATLSSWQVLFYLSALLMITISLQERGQSISCRC